MSILYMESFGGNLTDIITYGKPAAIWQEGPSHQSWTTVAGRTAGSNAFQAFTGSFNGAGTGYFWQAILGQDWQTLFVGAAVMTDRAIGSLSGYGLMKFQDSA